MNIKKALVTTLGTVAVVGAGIFATNDTANADVKVTVKQGDSVWSLANKYDSSINAIEKANSLNNDLIYVGQTLNVPNSTQATTTQAASVANNTYSHTTSQVTTNTTTSTASASTGVSGSEASAKAWIANKESSGSYSARNGQYVGKYQLSASYLNGDYSAANQEKVANSYVNSRYGSWSAAQAFWQSHGWY
ncbi:LysM peptidoglycan-binding domain-containing protein [Levilactobacillus brevis]|jgi:LysM repeat protein|uniref:Aggregation promoting factrelated surface protein n=3 Tax=Levilactobacillus brevis TaxID=1580 RepID=Q03U31_LEVBA|nr:LysM peptidoglycan-binding domain-containing protein [Levilactobacillus brevis]MBL3536157.1 LysM peptidoglycan-binding domain-containing protein [Lactobacillus sp. GPR40-2]MBL3629055.1 LysM peptidoglycan-binding domain-containing protein [Lactobacillus sp. GPB7-4]MBT1152780.1 LysM peptidoglycan-binding domain-containing protein [Lactiplantibacillus argentoratensis]ABJ63291.1 Aggregation promoting factrelated surface protein [Levilactobacillus brevis ATCC 367]ARQ93040.1 peptidoglycan-binding